LITVWSNSNSSYISSENENGLAFSYKIKENTWNPWNICNAVILTLGIYPRMKIYVLKKTCTGMFLAALFIQLKTGKTADQLVNG
jgi:hypothetical protein